MKQIEKLRKELYKMGDSEERLWLLVWIDQYEQLLNKREKPCMNRKQILKHT